MRRRRVALTAAVLLAVTLSSSLAYGRRPALGARRRLALTQLMAAQGAYARVHRYHLADPAQLRTFFPGVQPAAGTHIDLWFRRSTMTCATVWETGKTGSALSYSVDTNSYVLSGPSLRMPRPDCGRLLGDFGG